MGFILLVFRKFLGFFINFVLIKVNCKLLVGIEVIIIVLWIWFLNSIVFAFNVVYYYKLRKYNNNNFSKIILEKAIRVFESCILIKIKCYLFENSIK